MRNNILYKRPKFNYSEEDYQSYIYFYPYDHQKGKTFPKKLREIKKYCPYKGFDSLKEHLVGKKKVIAYVEEHILPKVAEDLLAGVFDKGLDIKQWTSLLQRRQSAEFVPVCNLIDEFIQLRYTMKDSISNKDQYFNALNAFKESLIGIYGKQTLSEYTLKDVAKEEICKQVFENWKSFRDWSDHTRKTYRHKVKVFFDAYRHIIPDNPVTKETRIKVSGKWKNIPLDEQDQKKIFSHLEKSEKKKHKELLGFALLMYNGLLRGDTIYKLRCGQIKKEAIQFICPNGDIKMTDTYHIKIYSENIKNKESGQVIIPAYVVEYLTATGIYDPAQPDKLLFPPVFKEKAEKKSSKSYRQRNGEHLRNRMWASNLWNYVLRNELGYSKAFTTRHNVYCLKPTGALYLLNEEKWDIREISAQMLHSHIMTTFLYIEKLRYHNADKQKRVFRHRIIGNLQENLAKSSDSPNSNYTSREQTSNKISVLSVQTKFS